MASLFIDGEWVTSGDGTCSPVVNPSDGTVITEVDVATDEQVQASIAAARRAFDQTAWPRTPTADRAALLDRVADLLERDLEELAREETLNTGKAMRESRIDIADVTRVFRYYANLAEEEAGRPVDTDSPTALSRIVYEPVGVCGQISPWNYPLLQASWKLAPALAAGNTVVVKPSEETPQTATLLGEVMNEVGVPAGVYNVVHGFGPGSAPVMILSENGIEHALLMLAAMHIGVPSCAISPGTSLMSKDFERLKGRRRRAGLTLEGAFSRPYGG